MRARALKIVEAHHVAGRDAREYFAPLLAALDENHEASLAQLLEVDAQSSVAMAHWIESGSGKVRRDFFLSLEKLAAVALALAAKLREEQE